MSKPMRPIAPKDVKLQVLPLGGVGRIGMNAMLLGCDDDWLLLDCGAAFPEPELTGVELVLPSLKTLGAFASKIRAIVLTHGHEDHIGALPYVLQQLKVPVYATRFTWGLLQHKLREHGLADAVTLHMISPHARVQIGPFDIGFLRVTHSLPDCVSLAIRTPRGNMVFTGDFKIEKGLRDGIEFDHDGFRAFGDEGVDLLMADSTNAEVPGWSGSETAVGQRLREVFAEIKGRIIVGLFASNIYRVHSIVDAARDCGRYCVLAGRSLERYTTTANGFTDMPFDVEDFIGIKEIGKYDDDELVIICTGSQAEPRAALARIATGSHEHVSIKPTDTVVLSARQIPGNERRIHAMLNDFARRGAHIIYTRTDRAIHASGHAYQDELRQMLQLVRPRVFVPVHGEYTFLQRHAELAAECGVQQTLIIENGQHTEISAHGARVLAERDVEPWYADGLVFGDGESLQLKARQQLGWHGALAVQVLLKRGGGVVTAEAKVQPHGVQSEHGELASDLETVLKRVCGEVNAKMPEAAIEGLVMQTVRKQLKRYTQRKPVILPFVRWLDTVN